MQNVVGQWKWDEVEQQLSQHDESAQFGRDGADGVYVGTRYNHYEILSETTAGAENIDAASGDATIDLVISE